jgi:hypothetical protein
MLRYVVFLLVLPSLLPAQSVSGALSGTVQDTAGAVMAGVVVRLTGEGNGFVRTATTSGNGFFSFPDLTAATFTLEIDAPGFKAYRQTGIAMSAGEERSLGQIHLDVGAVSERVTVSAEAVAVNLVNGEKSGVLTSDELDHLAVRGRDIFDAIGLLPGVVDTTDGREAPGPTSIGGIYIMGGRNDSKNMTVDGVTNLDTGSNGSVHGMPSMDSVAEVQVLMSAYSAQSGRNPSSINVITKGGGKDFHGGAAWYFRNEDLNANDFFNNQAGRPRSPYRYNIVNWGINGPLIIPKINRSRRRLFFMVNQEFQEKMQPYGTKTVTVPTALERQGDFSKSYNTNGAPISMKDPLNNGKAFPGNVIPASRLTAVGQAILNIFPLPNFVDPSPSRVYQWNYFSALSGNYPSRSESGRVDYAIKDNWQIYASVFNTADVQHTPYTTWVTGSLNFPLTPIVFGQPGRGASLHSVNTITPSLFNEVTLGVSQNTLTYYPQDPNAVNRTKLGILIPQRNPALNPGDLIPNMSFGGIQNAANPSLSNGTPYFNQNTIFQMSDSLSKVSGSHTSKAGVYFERTQKIQSADAATRGTLSFSADSNNALDSNNAYANALLGNYDSYAEATARPQGNFLFTNLEFFVQDTWRVRHNLSLDYGVRFYHDAPQYDARNQLASFSLAAFDPATAPVLLRPGYYANHVKVAIDPLTGNTYPAGLIGDFVPGVGNPADGDLVGGKNGVPQGLYTTAPISVAPRFGFAWAPFRDNRTVIRGGGGVYFDRIQGNPVMGQISNPPTIFTPTQYYGTFGDIAASVNAGLLSPNGSVTSLSGAGHQQASYQYSFAIQHQIGRSEMFEVSYVGQLGRHLLWQRNLNPVPLGASFLALNPQNHDPTGGANTALPTNFLRPLQGLGDVLLYEFAGTSNYNALLGSFAHRFNHGLNFNLAYTFSKVLDENDSYGNQVDAFVSPRQRNYGPAGYDRRHTFSASFYYTAPKLSSAIQFRPAHWILDRWTLSGVARMSTGGLFTPSYSLVTGLPTTPSGSASETARLDVVNPNAPLTQRFAPPPSGPPVALGNLGKNTITAPGVNNWDLSLYKDARFTERVTGQLRIESYNTFNHTQFSGVDQTLRFDTAGRQVNPLFDLPTSARPARRLALGVRLRF